MWAGSQAFVSHFQHSAMTKPPFFCSHKMQGWLASPVLSTGWVQHGCSQSRSCAADRNWAPRGTSPIGPSHPAAWSRPLLINAPSPSVSAKRVHGTCIAWRRFELAPKLAPPVVGTITLTGELTFWQRRELSSPKVLTHPVLLTPNQWVSVLYFLFHPAMPFLPQAGLFLFHMLCILHKAAGKALQASMEVA